MRIRKRLVSQCAAAVAAGVNVLRKPASALQLSPGELIICEPLIDERVTKDGASQGDEEYASMKLRGMLQERLELEVKDKHVDEQELIAEQEKINYDAASDSSTDAEHAAGDEQMPQRCTRRRSKQGCQCTNGISGAALDEGSIYCDYHQSKIGQHHVAWTALHKSLKQEDKIRVIRESSSSICPAGQNNMVNVQVLELPLFPSKQVHMYGSCLQAEDQFRSDQITYGHLRVQSLSSRLMEEPIDISVKHLTKQPAGALFKTVSGSTMSAAIRSYTEVQEKSQIGSDDLDLKLAPSSVLTLPNLVETDTATYEPRAQPAQYSMESAVLDTLSCKRRRIESAATVSEARKDQSEQKLNLTNVDVVCAGGPEHMKAITVFGSALCDMQEHANRCKERVLKLTRVICNVDNKQGTRDIDLRSRSGRRVLEQEQVLLQNDIILDWQQAVPSNMSSKEQDAKGSTASCVNTIEEKEQGHLQQRPRQCKRHDGRGWRCKQLCVQGKCYCEHHAQKQRSYGKAIKITTKDMDIGLQQQLPDKEIRADFCRIPDDVVDKPDQSNPTGSTVHEEIHEQTSIDSVQKDMSTIFAAKSARGSNALSCTEENDDLQEEEKLVAAGALKNYSPEALQLLQAGDEPNEINESKIMVREGVIESKCIPQAVGDNVDQWRSGKDRNVRQAGVLQRMGTTSLSQRARQCGRHDGRGWQCKSKCVEGSIYCEYHKEKVRSSRATWNASCLLQKVQRQQISAQSGAGSVLLQRDEEVESAASAEYDSRRPSLHVRPIAGKHLKPQTSAMKGPAEISCEEELLVEYGDDDDGRNTSTRIAHKTVKPAVCAKRKRMRSLVDIYARAPLA